MDTIKLQEDDDMDKVTIEFLRKHNLPVQMKDVFKEMIISEAASSK